MRSPLAHDDERQSPNSIDQRRAGRRRERRTGAASAPSIGSCELSRERHVLMLEWPGAAAGRNHARWLRAAAEAGVDLLMTESSADSLDLVDEAEAHGMGVIARLRSRSELVRAADCAEALYPSVELLQDDAFRSALARTGLPVVVPVGENVTRDQLLSWADELEAGGTPTVVFLLGWLATEDASTSLDIVACADLASSPARAVVCSPAPALMGRRGFATIMKSLHGAGSSATILPAGSNGSSLRYEELDDFARELGARPGRPMSEATSRLSGFYEQSIPNRLARVAQHHEIGDEGWAWLQAGGGLTLPRADRMSENVMATLGVPFSMGLNFRIDGKDVLIPMAIEEPSVVAAASNAALRIRRCGGFTTENTDPVMTTQVQVEGVEDAAGAMVRLEAARDELIALADAAVPAMVRRGGGCRDVEFRDIGDKLLVAHFYVDCRDAMGANVVDTVAEAVAERIAELSGGRIGLRILSNLPLRRMVRAFCSIDAEAVGSPELLEGVARASYFAERDMFRAITHNKGIMNGIDAVALACGQDWRSIEAGAHGYAAHTGTYKPLATWKVGDGGRLLGRIELPMAVGTVGGSTRFNPGCRLGVELTRAASSGQLGAIMACAGLASNLAALRALAGEGIQKGHMRLHARKVGRRTS